MYNSKRINVLVQIRTYWWEKLPKINKRTGTFIRNSRVEELAEKLQKQCCLGDKSNWTFNFDVS